MGGDAEFDWDSVNVSQLNQHRVVPNEFEQMMLNDPIYLDYQTFADEERYKVLGATQAGRVLIAVDCPREGRIRAVTAFNAPKLYEQLYWKEHE